MIFEEIELPGAFRVDLEPIADERGFFARAWCAREFEEHGLDARLVQCNVSYNRRRATLRGLHFQRPPHEEPKLVRCTAGAIWDVIVDLRPGSPTHRRWHGEELSAANRRALFVPGGCAHGFLTLADDSEVFYQMGEFHHPDSADGVRWDDPAFAIDWPVAPEVISERDRGYPDYRPEAR